MFKNITYCIKCQALYVRKRIAVLTGNECRAGKRISLKEQIIHFNCLQESIHQLFKEIAHNLAQTQGAFLTSIQGIGIILAAGVSAEIGDPARQKSLSNIVSYSGIIPRIKQTGGIQGKTQVQKVGKRCNHILKDYVVQSAAHMGLHRPKELS